METRRADLSTVHSSMRPVSVNIICKLPVVSKSGLDCSHMDGGRHGPLQRSLDGVPRAPMEARRGCGAMRTQPLNFCPMKRVIAALHTNSMIAPSSCGDFTTWCLLSLFCIWTVGLPTLARVVSTLRVPWIAAGDLNVPLQEFATSPWPHALRAQITVPEGTTSTCHIPGKKGSLIDFGMCSHPVFYHFGGVLDRTGMFRGALTLDFTSKFTADLQNQ